MAFAGLALSAQCAHCDALVVTKAMQANTIAEIFVEEQRIRIELEVGATDFVAFANILPDRLYEKIGGGSEPFAQRLRTFLTDDWIILADDTPLQAIPKEIAPDRRVVRDEVTGDALAEQPADAEFVIRLSLSYDLPSQPQSLTFRTRLVEGEATASIGFVCYHEGLPVNDFRYMPAELTLDLDWADPWYSRFRHRNFRRQFDAPLSVFLYVEPYEVRKEIIIRPRDVETWLDLKLPEGGVIPVDRQEELKRRVSEFLSNVNPVTVDGQVAKGRLDRIHFVRRTLRTTGIIEPPVDLDATSATLGVIFVYPIERLPKEVSMRWELFGPRIQTVPAATSDEAGGLPAQITSDDPVLTWKNYLTTPTSLQMLTVARPPSRRQLVVPILSVFCVGFVVAIASWHWLTGRRFSRSILVATVIAMIASVLLLSQARVTIADPFAEPTALSEWEAKEIASSLLYNVYRSFDHHDENLVYDRLEKSISGDLLSEVYLETRKSMEVKNQGGLHISVKEVAVTELESVDDNADQPTFRCRWRVSGWIGHWGHVHRRENEHLAHITLGVRDGVWKITGMELIDEQAVVDRQSETAT